jgi:DNA repair protein RecN (Recombination protein N)
MSKLGWDRPEFLFSANPGEAAKPLAQIASGGELSRLTLAMKCILARKDMVETVIFDEVDAGIGGKAAEAVAAKIRELALHHQVVCISHLPQIASGAQEHFLVEKNVSNGRTQTSINKLSGQHRVAELARMLDGKTVSEQSLAFAVELISRNSGKGVADGV